MLSREENELLVRVGPETGMGQVLRRFWTPALLSSEVPEPDCPPVRVRLLGEDLVAFRDTNGRVALLEAYCPHRRASLFWGRNEECGIRCVYHGWKFDADGQCVDIPNVDAGEVIKSSVRITSYPTVERSGLVWCYMGPPELIPPLPRTELFDVPESHRHLQKIIVPTNWVQSMEGDTDSSHVSFLHRKFDGPLYSADHFSSDSMFQDGAPQWTVQSTDYGISLTARRDAGPDGFMWRTNQWLMPYTTLVGARSSKPTVINIRSPIDDNTTMHIRLFARHDQPLIESDWEIINQGVLFPEMIPGTFDTVANAGNDYKIDRALQRTSNFSGIKAVPTQDYAVASDQGGGPIADRSKERLLKSDAVIVAMRRRLLQAAYALAGGNEPPEAHAADAYNVRAVDMVFPRDVDGIEALRPFVNPGLNRSLALNEA